MWLKYITSAALISVIAISGGKATYITAKAQLAQFLLEQAWQDATYSAHAANISPTRASAIQPSNSAANFKPWPWADIEPVAKLHVPDLHLQQIVLNDHNGEAMAFGPGLVENNGGFVLAGHRDSHFRFLSELEIGDPLILELRNTNVHHYQITETAIVDIRQQTSITPPPNSLVLVTCYPFNQVTPGGSLRFLVIATEEKVNLQRETFAAIEM